MVGSCHRTQESHRMHVSKARNVNTATDTAPANVLVREGYVRVRREHVDLNRSGGAPFIGIIVG